MKAWDDKTLFTVFDPTATLHVRRKHYTAISGSLPPDRWVNLPLSAFQCPIKRPNDRLATHILRYLYADEVVASSAELEQRHFDEETTSSPEWSTDNQSRVRGFCAGISVWSQLQPAGRVIYVHQVEHPRHLTRKTWWEGVRGNGVLYATALQNVRGKRTAHQKHVNYLLNVAAAAISINAHKLGDDYTSWAWLIGVAHREFNPKLYHGCTEVINYPHIIKKFNPAMAGFQSYLFNWIRKQKLFEYSNQAQEPTFTDLEGEDNRPVEEVTPGNTNTEEVDQVLSILHVVSNWGWEQPRVEALRDWLLGDGENPCTREEMLAIARHLGLMPHDEPRQMLLYEALG